MSNTCSVAEDRVRRRLERDRHDHSMHGRPAQLLERCPVAVGREMLEHVKRRDGVEARRGERQPTGHIGGLEGNR